MAREGKPPGTPRCRPVSEDEAHTYAEGVRRGGSVVVVRAEETRAAMAEQILDAEGATGNAYAFNSSTQSAFFFIQWNSMSPDSLPAPREQRPDECRSMQRQG